MGAQNGTLTYNGKTRSVIVEEFGYGLALGLTGISQARQNQTAYPRNWRKTDITLGLAFTSMEDYLEFSRWVAEYHMYLTSMSKPSHMVLSIPSIKKVFTVALTSFPVNIKFSDSAYQNTYQCVIVKDETGEEGNESENTGGVGDIPADKVDQEDIKAQGDAAFRGEVTGS
jgi:hypothetical protein